MNTTPGRLRLASAGIMAGLIIVGLVGTGAFQARQHAANNVGVAAEPLLVGSEVIYSSLADADATAAGTFLTPGQEPPARRARYLEDMKVAADRLAGVTRQVGSSAEAAGAAGVITHDLPLYAGLIEAARADNRQGLPVGAAYLRQGSGLMRNEILPATTRLYRTEAARLTGAYRSGRSVVDTGVLAAAAAVALALLVVTQLFLFRKTNRVLNLALLAATFLTLLAGGWAVVSFTRQSGHLQQARTSGSDPVQLLSSTRILTLRAQADEGLALVARGSGDAYLADFDAIVGQLGPPDGPAGLIHEADLAGGSPSQPPIAGPDGLYRAYLNAHTQVAAAEKQGKFASAVALATGAELVANDNLAQALARRITSKQQEFEVQASKGRQDMRSLGIGVPLLIVAAAISALVGLQQRINEYR